MNGDAAVTRETIMDMLVKGLRWEDESYGHPFVSKGRFFVDVWGFKDPVEVSSLAYEAIARRMNAGEQVTLSLDVDVVGVTEEADDLSYDSPVIRVLRTRRERLLEELQELDNAISREVDRIRGVT